MEFAHDGHYLCLANPDNSLDPAGLGIVSNGLREAMAVVQFLVVPQDTHQPFSERWKQARGNVDGTLTIGSYKRQLYVLLRVINSHASGRSAKWRVDEHM